MLSASAGTAFSHGCMPSHPRPTVVLKDMGACKFDPQTLSFAGEPVEQAKCLMRGMDATRNLAPPLDTLPPALAQRVGQASGLPSREDLSALLSKQNLEWDFAAYLWLPLSHANNNDPNAPMARYFVVHDTSGPSFGRRLFPLDVDNDPKINNLGGFKCSDGWGKAHVVINRIGGMLLDHELSIPWRETKFERAVDFSGALKGLFLHVELIQPRRSAGGHGWRWHNDSQTPHPSFTAAQYDRLALLYTIASVRAGRWLIPAFHAAIDAHIPNGHDDPLNFDASSFAASLDRVLEALQKHEGPPSATPADETRGGAGPPIAAWPTVATMESQSAGMNAIIGAGGPAAAAAAEARPSESVGEPKNHEHDAVGAGNCPALGAQALHGRACGIEVAEQRFRGRRTVAVRAVDRGVSDQGVRSWDYRGDVQPRHARGASRHRRA